MGQRADTSVIEMLEKRWRSCSALYIQDEGESGMHIVLHAWIIANLYDFYVGLCIMILTFAM